MKKIKYIVKHFISIIIKLKVNQIRQKNILYQQVIKIIKKYKFISIKLKLMN